MPSSLRLRSIAGPALSAVACLLASSCYAGSARGISAERVAADPGWEVVSGVPFVAQLREDDCGAAALAMVLGYSRSPTTTAELLVEAPPREGASAPVSCATSRGAAVFRLS